MKKLLELYEKYKDYIMVDALMYLVMFVGILLFFALAILLDWL